MFPWLLALPAVTGRAPRIRWASATGRSSSGSIAGLIRPFISSLPTIVAAPYILAIGPAMTWSWKKEYRHLVYLFQSEWVMSRHYVLFMFGSYLFASLRWIPNAYGIVRYVDDASEVIVLRCQSTSFKHPFGVIGYTGQGEQAAQHGHGAEWKQLTLIL